MRKRLIPTLVMVMLILSFGLIACSGASGAGSSVSGTQGDNPEEQLDTWFVHREKDDFGDEVEDGETTLCVNFSGEYSNAETSSSDLVGRFYLSYDVLCLGGHIILSETDSLATFTKGESVILQTKSSSGEKKEFSASVGHPNELMIANANELAVAISEETDSIRCIINTSSSKYDFTIPRANFDDAWAEWAAIINGENEAKKEAEEAEKAAEQDKYGVHNEKEAIEHMLPGHSQETFTFALNFIQLNIDEYEKLDGKQIEALFPGMYGTIDGWQPDGPEVIHTYEAGKKHWVRSILHNGQVNENDDESWSIDYSVKGDKLVDGDQSWTVYKLYDDCYLCRYFDDNGFMYDRLFFKCDEKGKPTAF